MVGQLDVFLEGGMSIDESYDATIFLNHFLQVQIHSFVKFSHIFHVFVC